jgi:Ca2+-binding RTX toxin-like protein
MTTFNVSSTAQLEKALSSAVDGDIIALATGDYSGLVISNINIDGNVTITSADASNPAVLTDLSVKNSSGITFSNLDFYEEDAGTYWNFTITNCSDVAIDNVTLHGPDNVGSGEESQILLIRNSSGVSVTNCEFYNLYTALNLLDCNGVTISNNSFHDIRMDGIRGGGNSDIVISSNYFTDFYPATGDHADCIQFWTSNTTTAASNITITDNLFVRGDGAAVQGIYMRDEVGGLSYQNVTISDNVILGALYNGITAGDVASGAVSDNIVAGYSDQKSWISTLMASSSLSISDNVATFYLTDSITLSSVAKGDNTTIAMNTGVLGTYILDWAVSHDLASTELNTLVKAALYTSFGTTSSSTASTYSSVVGTDANDGLSAKSAGYTYVYGAAGSDKLYDTAAGHNYLMGGDGNDTYYIYSSTTTVIEASDGGTDSVVAYANYTLAENIETLTVGTGNLTVYGNDQDNRINGSSGDDTIYGMDGADAIVGGGGNDTIYGGDGADTLYGNAGNDIIYGGSGNDILYGAEGNDTLYGGAGDDRLEGGAGADILTGGDGKDQFLFRATDLGSTDTITDFTHGTDAISLSLIDANTKTTADDAFTFIGTSAFTNTAGELRYAQSGGNTYIYADVNGDGVADLTIELLGSYTMTKSDFYL